MTTFIDTPTIAIIDSGAGGLCIAKEINNRNLNVKIQYVADIKHFPYGGLSDEALIERLSYLVSKLHQESTPDAILIACNTASTLALPVLRAKWKTPFVGVVPAVKPAAKLSKTKRIVVLATKATVERDYLSKLIKQHAQGTEVICKGSPALVEFAEKRIRNNKKRSDETADLITLKGILGKALSDTDNIDQLVLACTHFPIVRKEIESILKPEGVNVVDSTMAIVNRLCSVLPEIESLSGQKRCQSTFISTSSDKLDHYARFIYGNNIESIDFKTNY